MSVSPITNTGQPARLGIAHRQAANEHRAAELLALQHRCPVQERAFHAGAAHHERVADAALAQARQLAAARNRRLLRGYFSDAPTPRTSSASVATVA